MNRSWCFVFAPVPPYFLFHRPGASSDPLSVYSKEWRDIILKNGAGSGRVSAEHYQKAADFVKMIPGFDQRAVNTKYEK
jgi:hypothetical protein